MSLEGQLLDQKSLRAEGVTPQNILHTTVRRNEHLARLFHDLKLMENEGSGFDKVFEGLLSQGRPTPELIELHDRAHVIVRRRILKPDIVDFIAKADQTYQLTQRERIAACPDLAQNGAYLPSPRQRHAPSRVEIPPSHCCIGVFSLSRPAGASQSGRHKRDVNLPPPHLRRGHLSRRQIFCISGRSHEQQPANFIWFVADLLRGPYRPSQHECVAASHGAKPEGIAACQH